MREQNWKSLNKRLEALEESEALDGREQNRRDISRVRVNVPNLKSIELEENRGWKKSLLWWGECTQIP